MIKILFNSLTFLYFGIIVFLAIAIIKNKKYQHLLLLLASFYFYYYSSSYILLLLILTTLLAFYSSLAISKTDNQKKRKAYLIFSIVSNLAILGFFKYANFSLEILNYFSAWFGQPLDWPFLDILLPIGISFYTFQALSYNIDVYRKSLEPADSLLEFALYIAFFPQLVAGPIVRAADFLPQLKKKIVLTAENFKKGLTLIGWGLVKKVIFADNIAVFANSYFSHPLDYSGSLPVFIGALAFGIQIYCDFSGYSDIAIGLAKVFGLELKLNFDKPYFSTSFSEFWRRWHISLSTWLKDYLYIPLGGNRKGKARTYLNLMATMLLGGLWHGAAWNFVFWGFYQGLFLSLHKLWLSLKLNRWLKPLGSASKYLALIFTQYFVFMGWLIFRVKDTDTLFYLLKKYLSFDFSTAAIAGTKLLQDYTIPLLFLFTFLVLHTLTFFKRHFLQKVADSDLFYWSLYLLIVILSLYFLSPSETVQFIYFQF